MPEDKIRRNPRLSDDTSKACLFFDKGKFTVHHQGTTQEVADFNLRGFAPVLQAESLQTFFNSGGVVYVQVDEDENYSLEARQRALGGGLGAFAFSILKKVCNPFTVPETTDNDMYYSEKEVVSMLRDSLTQLEGEDATIVRQCIKRIQQGDEELLEEIMHNVNPPKKAIKQVKKERTEEADKEWTQRQIARYAWK